LESGEGRTSFKGIIRKVSWIYFPVHYWFALNWDKASTNCIALFCSQSRQTERQSLHYKCIACFLNVILRNGIQIRVLVCDVRKLPAADWPDPSWQSIDGCRSASSPHPSSAVLLCLLSHLDARLSLSVFLSLTLGSLYAASVLVLNERKCFSLWR
jgi:hypothetical protein